MGIERRFVVVHGEKLNVDGGLSNGFVKRLDKAIEALQKESCDLIIVSGGQTRKEFRSEAEIGAEYLRSNYFVSVLEERKSLTTVENIFNVARLIGENPEYVCAVSSWSRIPRLKYLYGKLCPEYSGEMEFASPLEITPILEFPKEIAHLAYNVFDLKEEASLMKYLRKTFRNGH